MKHIITLLRNGQLVDNYATLTALCKANPEIKYYSIKGMDFPINYKGFTIEKKEVKR